MLLFMIEGTGHGVGAALNVHEGPQGISFRYGNFTTLQKGMVVSNEPGYYEDHSFGIRIEVFFPVLFLHITSQCCVSQLQYVSMIGMHQESYIRTSCTLQLLTCPLETQGRV